MSDLTDLEQIKKILSRHGFTFSKALGQNFLIDPEICPAMAEESGADKNTGVLEIGPGIGVLTRELAHTAQKVVAVELDKRLPDVLKETLAGEDNVEVLCGDILKMDVRQLIQEHFSGCETVKVCANLPYYVTSPILMTLLESRLPLDSITVMVQREAAQRLCAPVGSRESGAVTVAVHYYALPETLFDVSRESFFPAPKVDSAVIHLRLRKEPPVQVDDEKKFFRLVKAAFAQRRKTAVNTLSAGLCLPKEPIAQALEKLGFSRTVRAETFTMEDFVRLCEIL